MRIGWLFGSRSAGAFARDRRGNVAMMWGLMGTVLVGLIGMTVDFTRAQALRAQLQNAADGAALVAERSSNMSDSQAEAAARAFFDAEMGDYAPQVTFSVTALGDGGHRVDARMPMPLSLASLVRRDPWMIRVASEAEASASPPIEVALVLDNTGSMSNDMQSLRDAANSLADFLLHIDGDTVSVALVPFVAQVNVGSQYRNSGWIDDTGTATFNGELLEDRQVYFQRINNCATSAMPSTTFTGSSVPIVWGPCTTTSVNGTNRQGRWAYNPATINYFTLFDQLATINSNYGWKGCVEARPEPYDIDDTAPSAANPATRFSPYFWIDHYGSRSNSNSSNSYLDDTAAQPSGWSSNYNTWYTTTSGGTTLHIGEELSAWKYRSGLSTTISTTAPNARGPNRGCPTPIVPLTTNAATVTAGIDAMTYWNGGGTNQVEGLAWGWRVLSPGEPFTQGRPYNDPSNPVRKVLVMMTDGENTNIDSTNPNTMQSDYSAYSHLGQWTNSPGFRSTLPTGCTSPAVCNRNNITSSNSFESYINTREETICQRIKDVGIEVYTIQFRDANSDNESRLRNCSSDPHGDHFFRAANATELQNAFDAIGSGIGDLRIVH
jgi:Flp pilus assembly protein TadG